MPDMTPRAIVLPAHAWGPIHEAILYYERRLRIRSARRPPPEGSTYDPDRWRAETLAEAAAVIKGSSAA